MTMWNNKAFTENELSRFAKATLIFLLVIPAILTTIQNIIMTEVHHPFAFTISLVGFVLFLISKISMFVRGVWISFGTKKHSGNMANLYLLGYWFMAVGFIFTFIR